MNERNKFIGCKFELGPIYVVDENGEHFFKTDNDYQEYLSKRHKKSDSNKFIVKEVDRENGVITLMKDHNER